MKLDEIAKLAGLSRTTVSYVVNGKAKKYRVSDKTIKKVQDLIEKHEFRPNVMAAGLRAGKSRTIGLVIPDFENISYAKIANQLEAGCREAGYQLLITCSNDNAESEIQCVKHLLQRQVDALLVSTALPMDTDFYQQAQSVPVIGFDRRILLPEVDNLLSDDEADAYVLAEKLKQKCDSADVLFFGALPHLITSYEREQGFDRAMGKKNINKLYAQRFHQEAAAQVFSQWLTENTLPKGIFITSLTLLQGVLQVLLKKYQHIPTDFVIATFGEHEMLTLLQNPIICSVQNHQKIVQSLLNLVLAKLENTPLQISHDPIRRELVYRHWG